MVADIYPFASVAAIFLGGCGKLAGMSPVSMSAARHGILSRIYPDILKVRTDFMTGDTVNVEALLRLRPQVVFANASNPKTLAELEAAHIPVIAVSATKWNYSVIKTFDEWVMLLSQVFPEDGGAKAKAVHGYSASVVSRIRSRVSRIPQPKRPKTLFLFQYGKDPDCHLGLSLLRTVLVRRGRREKRCLFNPGAEPERGDHDGAGLRLGSGSHLHHEFHAG